MNAEGNPTSITSQDLDHERELLFIETQGSVYLPLIGIFFWPALGIAGFYLSPPAWCTIVVVLTTILVMVIVSVQLSITSKLSAKSPLARLMIPALAPVLMSYFLILPAYYSNQTLVPVTLVIGLSLHWPVFGWLYNQPVYSIHVLIRLALTVLAWMFFSEQLFTWLPIAIGVLYLATAVYLLRQLRRLKSAVAAPATVIG